MELTNISTIKELMRRHNVNFSKSLGQNFLTNPTVCPRMAEMSGVDKTMGAIEIGPGVGVLTKELAKRAGKVVAIELDRTLLPVLEETLGEYDNVKVIHQDVLKVDMHKLIAEEFEGMEVAVLGNLPYYITSPIIMKFLEEKIPVKSITAMVQKEAAQRITAPIPSRALGAITISIAYYAKAETLFPVSKGSFLPAPKVESSVIKLNVLENPPVHLITEKNFFAVVKAAFSQRRKTLGNSLSSGLDIPKAEMSILMEKAGVSPSLRGEQLHLEDFAAIANQL